jgi:DNA replication protein DnaC
LLDEIRQGFSDDDKKLAIDTRLAALRTVPLAIFDDIGAERPSEWVRERLLTLLGHRYDNELTTIATSNMTLAELREPLGARIASRIEGMTAPIHFVTTDRRRKI